MHFSFLCLPFSIKNIKRSVNVNLTTWNIKQKYWKIKESQQSQLNGCLKKKKKKTLNGNYLIEITFFLKSQKKKCSKRTQRKEVINIKFKHSYFKCILGICIPRIDHYINISGECFWINFNYTVDSQTSTAPAITPHQKHFIQIEKKTVESKRNYTTKKRAMQN